MIIYFAFIAVPEKYTTWVLSAKSRSLQDLQQLSKTVRHLLVYQGFYAFQIRCTEVAIMGPSEMQSTVTKCISISIFFFIS